VSQIHSHTLDWDESKPQQVKPHREKHIQYPAVIFPFLIEI